MYISSDRVHVNIFLCIPPCQKVCAILQLEKNGLQIPLSSEQHSLVLCEGSQT